MNHISTAQEPHVASGFCIGQHRYRVFPSLQKVPLDAATVERGALEIVCTSATNIIGIGTFERGNKDYVSQALEGKR